MIAVTRLACCCSSCGRVCTSARRRATADITDEYAFVLCSLQADTSTAHSVHMDLLQSAQKTRRGSRG